jgi:16S rRNA (uracil1498-N3)-methyltransferase
MPRFFAEITRFPLAIIAGRGSVRHITGPLRKRVGDAIAVRVGSRGFQARISSVGSEEILLEIIEEESLQDRSNARVHLAMCLFDLKDLDDTIRCTAELGVTSIYPVISSRSNIRSITEARFKRWETIVQEAVKQCDRMTTPIIHRPVYLDAFLLETTPLWSTRLVAHKEARYSILEYRGNDCCMLIGPEGGFPSEELRAIAKAGFIPVRLGNTVLRSTTAAICAISILGL